MQGAPRAFDAGRFAAYAREAGLRRYGKLTYLPVTASTNDDAAAQLGDDEALGATIVADEQSAGAGRRGARWTSPAGRGLLFTTILAQPIAAAGLWRVPFWAGVCIFDALGHRYAVDTARTPMSFSLKYPNDVLLNGKKLCGILGTSRVTGERARAAVGIGINVFSSDATRAAAEGAPFEPIALQDAIVATWDEREALLAAILTVFERNAGLLLSAELIAAWNERANVAGGWFDVQMPNQQIRRVRDASLTEGGALEARFEDGSVARLSEDARIIGVGR